MSFEIVDSLDSDQIDDLLDIYRSTTWAKERGREDVERMLRGTDLVFGIVQARTGRLCAFARVLTDGVYRAVVFDVIVHPDFRGQGLARTVFEAVSSQPVIGRWRTSSCTAGATSWECTRNGASSISLERIT